MAQGNKTLIEELAKINPKEAYGTELFDALCRVTVTVAVEAVCIRFDPNTSDRRSLQVYLTQRSMGETAYPGQWHCPGSALRRGEEVSDVMDRLAEKEFGVSLASYKFVANANYVREERGHFFLLVHLCKLSNEENLKGKWVDIRDLPTMTVPSHRFRVIPMAVGAFLADNAIV